MADSLEDCYVTINIPGFGEKRALQLAVDETRTVSSEEDQDDCFVVLDNGKRAMKMARRP